jgi:hypothetical protein
VLALYAPYSKKWESLYYFRVQDPSFRRLVESVMEKIPDADAKEFPPFRVEEGYLHGDCLGHGSENVTLNLAEMEAEKLSDPAKKGVIAHEFAHVFLQHLDASWDPNVIDEYENEADSKAVEWGFEEEISAMRDETSRARDGGGDGSIDA